MTLCVHFGLGRRDWLVTSRNSSWWSSYRLPSLTRWVTRPEEKGLWKLSHWQLLSNNSLPRTSYVALPHPQRNRKYNLTISLEKRKIRNIWQRALMTVMPILNLATYHWVYYSLWKKWECFFARSKKRLEMCCPSLKWEWQNKSLPSQGETNWKGIENPHPVKYLLLLFLMKTCVVLFFNTLTTLILDNCICQAKLSFAVVTSKPCTSGTYYHKHFLLIQAASPL